MMTVKGVITIKNDIRMMIVMRLIYSIFKSFILIFVNIYLWKTGKSIQAVAVFNIFNYIAASASFYVGNFIALKNIRYNYILSSMSFMIAFAMTAYFGEDVSQYALIIGLLGGCGDGFFFFNLNSFQASKLNADDMDRFMSIIGGLNKASSIFTPLISGIIIESFGFLTMVNILLVLIVLQVILSFRMSSHNVEALGIIKWDRIFKNRKYRHILITNASMSPYSQFASMSNSVFLFTLTASESIIGILNSSFSLISIFMFILYRYLLRFNSRKFWMGIGALVSSLLLTLLIKPTIATFIIYGALISFGSALYQTPLVGVQLRSSKIHSDNEAEMLGNLFMRVLMLNMGRVIFFTLVYFFYVDFTSPIFIGFLIYNFFTPLVSYQLSKESI